MLDCAAHIALFEHFELGVEVRGEPWIAHDIGTVGVTSKHDVFARQLELSHPSSCRDSDGEMGIGMLDPSGPAAIVRE